jgi:hypothetical protein
VVVGSGAETDPGSTLEFAAREILNIENAEVELLARSGDANEVLAGRFPVSEPEEVVGVEKVELELSVGGSAADDVLAGRIPVLDPNEGSTTMLLAVACRFVTVTIFV